MTQTNGANAVFSAILETLPADGVDYASRKHGHILVRHMGASVLITVKDENK